MNNDEIIVFFLVGIKIYWFNKKIKINYEVLKEDIMLEVWGFFDCVSVFLMVGNVKII